jgi:hypothetical protein
MCDPSGVEPLGLDQGGQAAGARLLALSGLAREEYEAAFERVNLIQDKVWRPIHARLAGGRFYYEKPNGVPVLVLGREVWKALGLTPVRVFTRVGDYTLLPHPSGRNIELNKIWNKARVRSIMKRMAANA